MFFSRKKFASSCLLLCTPLQLNCRKAPPVGTPRSGVLVWSGWGSDGGLLLGAVGGVGWLGMVGRGMGGVTDGAGVTAGAGVTDGAGVQDAHVQCTGGDPVPKLVHFLW